MTPPKLPPKKHPKPLPADAGESLKRVQKAVKGAARG